MTKYRLIERNDGKFQIERGRFIFQGEPLYWECINNFLHDDEQSARDALLTLKKLYSRSGTKRVVEEIEV